MNNYSWVTTHRYFGDPISKNDVLQRISEKLGGNALDLRSRVSARKKYFVAYLVDGGEIYMFDGDENRFTIEKTGDEPVNVLRGKVAYRGRIQGPVKVIKSKDEIDRLDYGDILVAPTTMPDMVVGLQKCGGIITDEGGIACHAAQISRELRIPCIVGTGNGSRVLKDGVIVELVAEGIDGEVFIKH